MIEKNSMIISLVQDEKRETREDQDFKTKKLVCKLIQGEIGDNVYWNSVLIGLKQLQKPDPGDQEKFFPT